jgi:2-iminobutanoate/2-iminopropanoate deaminase
MEKQTINTKQAPAPIGPYSQAISAGQMIFISGQIPVDPSTDQLVSGDISDETRQVMKNLKAILSEAGMDFSHVVKTTIFVTDLANFGIVNDVYGKYFDGGNFPARETVEVSRLPKGVGVEISMIAAR